MSDIQETLELIKKENPYTNFPTAVDTFERKSDLDLTTKPLADQYYQLLSQNKFDEITGLLENNASLKKVITLSADYNKLRDGLIAVQRIWSTYLGEYLVKFSQPKGIFNKSAKYRKYNVVNYEVDHIMQTYIAMPADDTEQDIPIGSLPTDDNYWKCITMRGEKGDPGSGLAPQGPFVLDKQYHADDMVSYNNCLWYAVSDSYNQVPNKNSSSWQLLLEFTGDLLMFNNSNSTLTSTTVQGAILELDHRTKLIKNIVIPKSGFINNVYTYTDPSVSSYHSPDVRFSSESRPAAVKANLFVEAFDGYLSFTVKKLPADDLKVDLILLTET